MSPQTTTKGTIQEEFDQDLQAAYWELQGLMARHPHMHSVIYAQLHVLNIQLKTALGIEV